jgi:hypothetical protein
MPDHRAHRGPHPKDRELFGAEQVPLLQRAAAELCWLLDRDYPSAASLKLVGDRHSLIDRQRIAVARCSCSAQQAASRRGRQCLPEQLAGGALWIDGYNVLTSIEAALGGGAILLARDGTFRDMASMHGTYRRVAETESAIRAVAEVVAGWGIVRVHWLLDAPVSNSGRLKQMLLEMAADAGWPWEVALVPDPDRELVKAMEVVASSDSHVLDGCKSWANLARTVIEKRVPQAWVIDLSLVT